MNWWWKAMTKYAVFSGRARRKEYWYFILFTLIFGIVAVILDRALGIDFKVHGQMQMLGPIDVVFRLAVLLPSLAVVVRRLHDTGRSGWWFFISFIPIIGTIWILVLMCLDSTPGSNNYGPNPKD